MDGSFHGSRSAGTERDQVGHHHVRPVVGRHDHQRPTRDRFQGIKVKQLLFHTPAYDAFPLHFTGNFASDIFLNSQIKVTSWHSWPLFARSGSHWWFRTQAKAVV